MQPFSIPLGTASSYAGNVDAAVYEGGPPADTSTPVNHIRTTQPWGVHVEWTVQGSYVPFLVDEFRVRLFIESIGPGLEVVRPPVVVPTMSVGLQPGNVRSYSANVEIAAGEIPAGVYKLACLVQMHDDVAPGTPFPIVSCIELPIVTIFAPA
jgi:hypothetical protein